MFVIVSLKTSCIKIRVNHDGMQGQEKETQEDHSLNLKP